MFISIRRAMRERKEALQTPRSEPRHASTALPANTVQLGILGLVAGGHLVGAAGAADGLA